MFFTVMLLILLLLLLLYLGMRKPKGYPPGPRWLPILGSALEVARIRQETGYLFKTCSELCKRYGPVVGIKIGTDRMVILNEIESIRETLMNEDFDGRPIGPMYAARTWGSRKGLIVVDGHFWVEQRRFVLRHLREFGFGRTSMATIVEDEAQYLVEHFKKLIAREADGKTNGIKNNAVTHESNGHNNGHNNGQIYKLQKVNQNGVDSEKKSKSNENGSTNNHFEKVMRASDMYVDAEKYPDVKKILQPQQTIISMHDAFGVSVLNTLWMMMAAKRFNTDNEKLKHLQRILSKLLGEIDMIGAPFGHFPILRFIAPEMSGYKPFVETHKQIWAFLREELDNHKNTFDPEAPRDLMDVYLTALQSKNYDYTFTESQLLAICVDLFVAGSDTTSKTLGFCFLYLVLHPEIQKKAQDEMDRVIGRERYPTLADRARLPYVHAVVLESLRMFIGRTLNVPHRAVKDSTIAGYRIPKDTMIIVNFNRILMDESWRDPDAFRPERFLDEENKLVIPDRYFPFGIGRHRCMGETLARSNVFVMMATLLHAFTFSAIPGEKKPSSQDFIDGVTSGPKPFKALLTLRT